jgi:hypothetical protein
LRLRSVDGLEQRQPGVPVSQELQNVLVGQCVLPRVDDAAQVNVGAKVMQRPLGRVWSRRLRRSTELVYGLVNLRDDEVDLVPFSLNLHSALGYALPIGGGF